MGWGYLRGLRERSSRAGGWGGWRWQMSSSSAARAVASSFGTGNWMPLDGEFLNCVEWKAIYFSPFVAWCGRLINNLIARINFSSHHTYNKPICLRNGTGRSLSLCLRLRVIKLCGSSVKINRSKWECRTHTFRLHNPVTSPNRRRESESESESRSRRLSPSSRLQLIREIRINQVP